RFAALKRQTQLLRTDEDTKNNDRLSFLAPSGPARWGRHASGPSAAPRRLDRGDVDFRHSHHRLESAFGFVAASRERVGQHARRVLPGNSPLVLAPPALALLPAIADDCVPVAVRLCLVFGRDLEREGFVVLEHRAAVEAETGYAEDREIHRQHVALLSAGIVAGRMEDRTDRAVGKGGGIEAGSRLRVLVVPQANCVLAHCLTFRFAGLLDQGRWITTVVRAGYAACRKSPIWASNARLKAGRAVQRPI